jgi:cell division protein ZapB
VPRPLTADYVLQNTPKEHTKLTSGSLKLSLNNGFHPLYSEHPAGLRGDVDLTTLEKRIDELIALCDELERKHVNMDAEQEKWLQERTRLLEKNELAKSKIEAMIMRLKSLEQD